MAAMLHVGDIGTVLRVTILDEDGTAVNVSTATTKLIWLVNPIGTETSVAAAFTTDGSNGQIQYTTLVGSPTTVPGTLNKRGEWSIWASVVLASGVAFTAGPAKFGVDPSPVYSGY